LKIEIRQAKSEECLLSHPRGHWRIFKCNTIKYLTNAWSIQQVHEAFLYEGAGCSDIFVRSNTGQVNL
jgi:hypothetical protein